MRKILFLSLIAIVFNSCKKDAEAKIDSFVISGEIKNFRKRNIRLEGFNFEKKIKFDRKTKKFTDTIKNLKAGHYYLVVGKRPIPLYLSPNEDLSITVDAKKRTKDPVFQGKNSSINSYLGKRRKKFGLVLGNARKFFSVDENDFVDKNDEYKDALLKLAESSQLPPEYLEIEKRNIDYEGARNLNNYQKYHQILTGNPEYEVSDEFPSEVEEMDFNNPVDYQYSSQYRNLLKEYLNELAEKKTPEDGDSYLTYLETIHTEVTDTLVKNDLIHLISDKALTYTSNMEEFYKKYMGYSTSAKNKREITDMYNKLKLTARGKPSPKFTDYINYEGGKTSLDDLTGNGKYLYIDIWATWCGFCKKEIPLLKNFEIKYHGKNIDFVSINVDKKNMIEKWKETIIDKEMGGVQLFAGDSHLNLDFTKNFLIKGLPRFIILDPEGKIVTANAPRPSDGEKLDEIFEELGIEGH